MNLVRFYAVYTYDLYIYFPTRKFIEQVVRMPKEEPKEEEPKEEEPKEEEPKEPKLLILENQHKKPLSCHRRHAAG